MELNKKYPKSLTGKQCLGPCYKKNTKIIHPLYLFVVSFDKPFCPVAEHFVVENNKKIKAHVDECIEYNENNIKNLNLDILYPNLGFNASNFLNIYYNINNFGEGIEWITQNTQTSINTRERIFNLIFEAFNKDIDIIEISDNRITDFISLLIKTKYNDSLSKLFKYINIDNNFASLHKYSYNIRDKTETNETIIIKTNYIIKNLITYDNISNFITKNIKSKIESSVILSYSEILIDKFISFLIDNIKKTFLK
jgi:hypothetical protein